MRWPFLLTLLLALAAVGVRYTVLDSKASGSSMQTLSGVTGQGTAFQLAVDRGHVRWLRTRLTAKCAGGSHWSATWSPIDGIEIRVKRVGHTFSAFERSAPGYSNGIVGRVAFAIRGSIKRDDSAQGTVRLVARFYRGERQWNACDTLDVAWAVGPRARERLRQVTLGRQTGFYFPEVPTLATDVSPERKAFIELVDDTCVRVYNTSIQAENEAAAANQGLKSARARNMAYYLAWHLAELRALTALGEPPQVRKLYDAWLEVFRQRVAIERGLLLKYERTGALPSRQADSQLTALKRRDNLLGQEFGLVRCTSNGDRTPVPVLSDGQPLPLS